VLASLGHADELGKQISGATFEFRHNQLQKIAGAGVTRCLILELLKHAAKEIRVIFVPQEAQ
jgi:hypothetical protein